MSQLSTLLVLREESHYENQSEGRRKMLFMVFSIVLGAMFGASLLLAAVGFGMWGAVVVLAVVALIGMVVTCMKLLVRTHLHSPLPLPTHADQV